MGNPLVTVFVTVYNIEKYLDRFFECLLEQTMPDFEALIIDDGSEDNSLSICKRYAEKNKRIRIISVDHIGISAARNIALQNIHTEFVTSMDGDDFYDKDYLKHLVDAQKKYDADYVISNVIYIEEDMTETGRFVPREGGFYTKESFPDLLPMLFSEERLTYLYGKLFKADLLNGISVEADVKSGSDKRINFQYILKINNLVVIEDYDSYYIRYTSRSVTSYRGDGYHIRYYNSIHYVRDILEKNGLLSEKMLEVLDRRIMVITRDAVDSVFRQNISMKEKYKKASDIINCDDYQTSYARLEKAGVLNEIDDKEIPRDEDAYFKMKASQMAQEKKDAKKKALLSLCPDSLFNAYHSAKIKLGLIPPDKQDQS